MSACRPIIVASAILMVVLVIASVIAKAQTSQANAQVILNLQNGQQYFGTPRVYQGDYNGTPTSQWPVYYEPSTASQYWGSPKINQPVLALVSAKHGVAGAMFWDETYIGGPVKITIIGTFSSGWPPGQFADGFVIYLFLKPTMWSVSPQYNYSVSYISTNRLRGINVYLGGDVIIPQSSTPYLIVQWNPFLRPVYRVSGQWNVVILSNINGANPSVVAGWSGIGTGFIHPNPGDRINITVTYDPSTNTLSGVATNLNTGQSASFTLNLGRYFTPPSSGNYVFGTGAGTGWGYANWALLYVAMSTYTATDQRSWIPVKAQAQLPSGLNLIPYFHNSFAMGGVYLNFTKAELGLFMPPVMFGNLSIPGILDFNKMSYFVHTLEGPYVFNTTLGGWNVYGFTFISLPTYGNGSVVNTTHKLQKTMIIAYKGGKVIVLLYYRNLAPVSLKLNQYWSHIHKGVDGLSFTVFPSLFNPYTKATKEVIRDAYYIAGNTSLYVNGRYLGRLNSFGLWQVLPVGPITLINNAGRWIIQLIPMNNLSTTQQIQLVTSGFSIDDVKIANSFFDIQHAEVVLMPNRSAQYVYSIGINTQPPNYTEISGIINYLLQIASSPKPHISSSLTVQVFNVLGRSATTVPGVVFGVLYNSNFKEVAFMNSSGYLNFNNINPGTYTLEVYHYPNTGLNLTEYWGGMTVSLKPGNNFVTFYRHKPWIYDLQVSSSNKEIVITVTVNGTVTSPTKGKIELWVTNNPPSASPNRPSKVFDVTITPGLNIFSFTYPVSQADTYYVYAAVLTHISTYTVTDQWNWTPVQVQTQLVKVTVQAIDGFGTVRNDWPVVIENVASGMGQVDAELVEGQQYVARVTGLSFTNTTTFVAKGPQMVIRLKIPTAKIMAQAIDGFGNVRSEWRVQIDGVAAGQGVVGPIEVLSGRYTVRTWAFGKEFSRSVEVSTGQVAVIQVRVPTARLTIAVFDDAGRQIDDLVTAVELAGPLTLGFSSLPKNLEVLAGTYTIKITGPGWEGAAQVTLQEGERKNISIVIHGAVATRERRPETTVKASTNTAPPEGEFTWLVKISGDAFFWVFMIAVVGAIVIIVIRRRR